MKVHPELETQKILSVISALMIVILKEWVYLLDLIRHLVLGLDVDAVPVLGLDTDVVLVL